jgi:hypothetical protein
LGRRRGCGELGRDGLLLRGLGCSACWVGLEGRVGVDSLGILVLGLKGIQTQKEFKPEFEFQQTKEMHQHECNN